jgi:hypothetical protein
MNLMIAERNITAGKAPASPKVEDLICYRKDCQCGPYDQPALVKLGWPYKDLLSVKKSKCKYSGTPSTYI